jgi:presequence protease
MADLLDLGIKNPQIQQIRVLPQGKPTMTQTYGFELIQEREIPELNSLAQLYRHIKTGAQFLSIQNKDENKVFNITFRTPPEDSTGLPHIMEHSVLGGSRKYPSKEPFLELIKGSLNTFVNAFTFPDQTSYPVASANLADFYNLVEVYLDAVFYPLITPDHLAQEGWHYELESLDAPLNYRGVVFNEMKGNYSSPENLLASASQEKLLPDTPYGVDSGGDPRVIPNLTYEQFKRFHQTYYHPSNARIFFYGDDDPAERLRILDGWLSEFEPIVVDSGVSLQTPFSEPRRHTLPFAVDKADMENPKGYAQVNWALPEETDPARRMMLEILSYALVSTPASPLRKALIDSGLGEQITGGGLNGYTRQPSFSVGLKGVAWAKIEQVEPFILETLQQLAATGIEREMIEAALNSVEFSLRENNTGSFPQGLLLSIRALDSWVYDHDPLTPLAFEKPLQAVKEQLTADPAHLQTLIRQHLLDNPHRVTILLQPDADHAARLEQEERAKLDAIQAAMSGEELEAAVAYTHALRERQSAPDDPAALAKIPRLTLADLDRETKQIPSAASQLHGAELVYHDLFTNGLLYLDLGFNLRALPQELLPYVGLFGRALLEMGTETEDFVKLSQRIGGKTGGIRHSSFHSPVSGQAEGLHYLFLRGKATMSQTADLLAILRDILLTVKLDNPARFLQIVREAKAGMEARLLPAGHMVVGGRLAGHFHEAGWVNEQISGVAHLLALRQLEKEIEADWTAVLTRLEAIKQQLINQRDLVVNVTLDGDNWAQFQPELADFVAGLPEGDGVTAVWRPDFPAYHEGLTVPAQVNYVGKGVNLYDLGYQLDGSVSVIASLLRLNYLWEHIRVKGGAYGAMGGFDWRSGLFTFVSYRDPNLRESLATYDGAAQFLRDLELSDDELTKGIIGAISSLDAYQLPDAKGFTALQWHLLGETHEARQQYREQVLDTTQADFKAFAEVLTAAPENGRVVIMGAAEALTAVNDDDWLQITKLL